MGVQEFLNYNSYIDVQNKNLEIWGQGCTVFVPNNLTNLGYENTNSSDIEKMNADEILNVKYSKYNMRIWINFTVSKNVFYKFNWFPEDGDELCMAFMDSNSFVRENAYIRTALPEQTSIWGDMIFQVVKIQDVGIARTLQRVYFLKPTSNLELYNVLEVGMQGDILPPTVPSSVIIPTKDPTSGGGTGNYNDLTNKPKLNGVTIESDKSQDDYNIDVNDKYTDEKGATADIGGISKGEKFDDTNVTEVIDKLLHPYTLPYLKVEIEPSEILYPKGTILNEVTIKVNYKKTSNDIKYCRIYANEMLIYADNVNPKGKQIEFTYDVAISNNVEFKVEVGDGIKSSLWEETVKFIPYSYYGVLDDNVEIDETSIQTLTSKLMEDSTFTYEDATIDYGRIVYAYPTQFGELSIIYDNRVKWDVTDSFTHKLLTINGSTYHVYYMTDSSKLTNANIEFRG